MATVPRSSFPLPLPCPSPFFILNFLVSAHSIVLNNVNGKQQNKKKMKEVSEGRNKEEGKKIAMG